MNFGLCASSGDSGGSRRKSALFANLSAEQATNYSAIPMSPADLVFARLRELEHPVPKEKNVSAQSTFLTIEQMQKIVYDESRVGRFWSCFVFDCILLCCRASVFSLLACHFRTL